MCITGFICLSTQSCVIHQIYSSLNPVVCITGFIHLSTQSCVLPDLFISQPSHVYHQIYSSLNPVMCITGFIHLSTQSCVSPDLFISQPNYVYQPDLFISQPSHVYHRIYSSLNPVMCITGIICLTTQPCVLPALSVSQPNSLVPLCEKRLLFPSIITRSM